MLRRPEQKLKTLADRVFACVIGLDGPVPKIIERADQRSKAFKPPKMPKQSGREPRVPGWADQARSGRVEGSDRALDQGRNAERFNFLRTRGVLFIPRTAVACKPRTVSVPRLPLAHVGDRLLHSSGRH